MAAEESLSAAAEGAAGSGRITRLFLSAFTPSELRKYDCLF